jgi:hypothetical protein
MPHLSAGDTQAAPQSSATAAQKARSSATSAAAAEAAELSMRCGGVRRASGTGARLRRSLRAGLPSVCACAECSRERRSWERAREARSRSELSF